jgi:hypothetical protein
LIRFIKKHHAALEGRGAITSYSTLPPTPDPLLEVFRAAGYDEADADAGSATDPSAPDPLLEVFRVAGYGYPSKERTR